MNHHIGDSTLQIAGSASLFYIIRQVNMNRVTKRRVVTALLNGNYRIAVTRIDPEITLTSYFRYGSTYGRTGDGQKLLFITLPI
jgi:hypothetical protein